jgi:hypothetical protein
LQLIDCLLYNKIQYNISSSHRMMKDGLTHGTE